MQRRSGFFFICLIAFNILFSVPAFPVEGSLPLESVPQVFEAVVGALDLHPWPHFSLRELWQDKDLKSERTVANKIFDRYVEQLDPQRIIFTQGEISRWRQSSLEQFRELANFRPTLAFEIYKTWFARVTELSPEREYWAQQVPDFTVDEKLLISTPKNVRPWPADAAARSDQIRRISKAFVMKPLTEGKSLSELQANLLKLVRGQERSIKIQDPLTQFTSYYLSALLSLYDPHSKYLAPLAADAKAQRSGELSFFTAGFFVRLDNASGDIVVRKIAPGGAAQREGSLAPGDIIEGISPKDDGNFLSTEALDVWSIGAMLNGPQGSGVGIRFRKPGSSKLQTIHLERGAYRRENTPTAYIETRGALKLGRIKFSEFYSSPHDPVSKVKMGNGVSEDLTLLIRKLKEEKISGLTLDLRGNTGGDLSEAVAVAGLFIKGGPLVYASYGVNFAKRAALSTSRIVYEDPQPLNAEWEGPLVVLIDKFSASASELVAAALQDYHRAVIVGHRSFGKGTIQNLIPIPGGINNVNLGEISMTIGRFYRVSGETTQWQGVRPQIEFPDDFEGVVGENLFEESLKPDRFPGPKFRTLLASLPVKELSARSAKRCRNGSIAQQFQAIREDQQRNFEREHRTEIPLRMSDYQNKINFYQNRLHRRALDYHPNDLLPFSVWQWNLEELRTQQPGRVWDWQSQLEDAGETKGSTRGQKEELANQVATFSAVSHESMNILADLIRLQRKPHHAKAKNR